MNSINLSGIKSKIVDNVLMKNIGLRVVTIIRRRTLDGKFISGSEAYSTKPFVMPLGAMMQNLQRGFLSEDTFKRNGKTVEENEFQIFTANNGATWVWIEGGYKRYRELSGRQVAKVDLNWSGRMMRNLGLIPGTTTPRETEIGFTSAEEKQKALWHNTLGAGKGKTKREFMGLTPQEYNDVVKFAGEEITKNIATALSKYTVA